MIHNIDLRLKDYATLSNQAVFTLLADVTAGDLTLPRDLETDGATVPRWVLLSALLLLLLTGLAGGWFKIVFIVVWILIFLSYLFPPFGRYTLAAMVHDMLLKQYPKDRHYADVKMKEVLETLRINTFWRGAMYRAVRINSFLKNKVMG